MAERKTVSTITDTELSFLYDLLAARYPCSSTESFVATFEVPSAQPKQRHRTGNGRSYTPKETKDAEAEVAWRFKREARGHAVDAKSRFGLHLAVTGANSAADVDNLAKTVMDGLNGICWKDDRQVDELHVRHLPGRERRTEVTVYRIEEGALCRGSDSMTGSRRTGRSSRSPMGPTGCIRPRFSGVLANLLTGVYRNVTSLSWPLAQ